MKLISCEKGGDYFDAIHLSDIALKSPGFYAEGAKNVARRDGMACTVLSAVTHRPHSRLLFPGRGQRHGRAIAAWEANMRLVEDGAAGGIR